MVLAKVKWPLVNEKQNFLNRVRDVLEKYEHYGVISKMSKNSHLENYNSFYYSYKEFLLSFCFIHSRAKFYFLISDPEMKCTKFQRMDICPQYAIIDIFNLNARHFFPLDTQEQVTEILKFFESCFEKIDKDA